jgi:hypothetical protein
MAFKPLRLVSNEDLKSAVIANSQTITIGDAITPAATSSAGAVTGATGSYPVVGIVVSIVGANGQVLEKSAVTVASNNETVGIIGVQYIPTYIPMEYSATLSNTAGVTSYSKLPGMFALSTQALLDETSWTVYSTVKQFFSFGVDPLVPTQVIGHFTPTTGQV